MIDSALEFLQTLFIDIPQDNYLLIWTKSRQDKKVSNWFQSFQEAADFASIIKHDNDVYFGLGLSPENYGPYSRCKKEEVTAIGGLWIDIDVKGDGHKKQDLPESLDEALDLLLEVEFMPSTVVKTGGGLQAYWNFGALWQFEQPGERQKAAMLQERWVNYLNRLAKKRGWTLDAVQDFARVFRLPGTFNLKIPGNPRTVEIMEQNGRFYGPGDLTELLDRENVKIAPRLLHLPKNGNGQSDINLERLGIKLDPQAQINEEAFQFLAEEEPKFLKTWERKRGFGDDTSKCDLSLASYAVNAGWENQDIANLLIAFRRKWGELAKALRPDYIARTIERAHLKNDLEQEQTGEELRGLKLAVPEQTPPARAKTVSKPVIVPATPVITEETESGESLAQSSPDSGIFAAESDSEKLEFFQEISKRFFVGINSDIRLIAIYKILGDPISFRLDTSRGSVNLGGAGNIISQSQFKIKIATATSALIPKFSSRAWEEIAAGLLRNSIEIKPDVIETPAGFVKYWLEKYLQAYSPEDESEEVIREAKPFKQDYHIFFFLEHFKGFLRLNNVGLKNYSVALKEIKCNIETLGVVLDGKRTTRSVWRVPNDFV